MKKSPTKKPSVKSAMSQLASIGGNAVFKKYGKGHMSKLALKYWNSPAGKARRAASKKGRALAKYKKKK